MKESIIGKLYRPRDNSWAVNITSCTEYPYKNKNEYLAGGINKSGKDCIIKSEPFECNVLSYGLENPKSIQTMIIVEYEGETHMVLFHKEGIK